MAPFKLKFRMGSSSRSTSFETAPRMTSPSITTSTTTIDDIQSNSLASLNNDERNLLPDGDNDGHIGYSNPAIMQHLADSEGDLHHPLSQYEKEDCHLNSSSNCHLNPPIENARSPSIAEFDSDSDLDEEPSTPTEKCATNNAADSGSEYSNREALNNDECNILPDNSAQNTDDDCNSQNQQIIPNTIIGNKSTKRIYKEVAKQWGITCQMSEQCRCMDCQGQYFKCDYHGETESMKIGDDGDGGLGAGTPMFIGEVMHGSACTIL